MVFDTNSHHCPRFSKFIHISNEIYDNYLDIQMVQVHEVKGGYRHLLLELSNVATWKSHQ